MSADAVPGRGRALLARIGDAWNARDLAGMLDTYATDAVIVKPGHPVVSGHAEIEPWLRGRLGALGEFRADFVYRASEGDWLCVEYDTHSHPPGGEPVHVRGAELFLMDAAGRIRLQRQYNYTVAPGAFPMALEPTGGS
jgi:ketosteroid isomerase-like protein